MPRYAALVVTALALGACATDKGFGEVEDVTASEYGARWPLTVDTARLNRVCADDTAASVLIDGEQFVISDLTSPDDAEHRFLRFWATDPSQPSERMDLTPLVDDANALCD